MPFSGASTARTPTEHGTLASIRRYVATVGKAIRVESWPGTGKPPAWSRTTRPARPPNAGPSESICEAGTGDIKTTSTPQHSGEFHGRHQGCQTPKPSLVMGEQDLTRRAVLSRNHHQPAPDKYKNSQGDEAVAARPRPLAHLSHVRTHAPAAPHVKTSLPAVRREHGQGHRPRHC